MKYLFCCCLAWLLLAGRGAGGLAQPAARTIEIHAKRFSFAPAEITLTKGETVTLDLTTEDVPHALLIEGLHINSAIPKGHVTQVTLTPQTAGDFHGKCGRFCGSGHGTMLFVVHVVEK